MLLLMDNPNGGYGKDYFPRWVVEDSTLRYVPEEAGSLKGGDIIYDEKFVNLS